MPASQKTAETVLKYIEKGRGYTKSELSKVTGFAYSTIENNLYFLREQLKDTDREIVSLKQPTGEIKYWLANKRITTSLPEKQKKFSFIDAKFPNPFLFIQIPDDVGFYDESYKRERIDVIPVADIHYGCVYAKIDKFKEWIDWILRNDHVYTFGIGDLMEQSTKQSIADGIYHQDVTPQRQIIESAQFLHPISDKLLFLTRGNHERRQSNVGLDVMEMVAKLVNTTYKFGVCQMVIQWRGNQWSFRCWHGHFSGWTEGGKVNSALRARGWNSHRDFFVSAHVHDKKVLEFMCEDNDLQKMETILKSSWLVITGSMMGYYGTYATERNWPPGVPGFVRLGLYEDGDVHITL